MHVFHIRGFSGLLLLLLAVISTLALAVLLPAAFMMVFWNAVVYEAFQGPELNLYQGFLLWGALAVAIKVLLKPEIKFQFQNIPNTPKTDKSKGITATQTAEATEEEPAQVIEDSAPPTLDKQN